MQVLTFPAEMGTVIQNALIIQHSIERLVLVDDQSRAMQLIRAQTGVQVTCSALLSSVLIFSYFSTPLHCALLPFSMSAS